MRLAILGLLLAAGVVSAGELIPLHEPALDGIGLAARTACVGSAFTASGTIVGACHTVTSSPCSGRGCQPVTLTTNYIATWDASGYATGAQACDVVRHHAPQADTVTYLNGHSAGDCPSVIFNPTGSVVMIDGVPYFYVSTDAATGNELVDSNSAGYLFENF